MLGTRTPMGKGVSPATARLLKSSGVFNKIQNHVSHGPECPNSQGNSYPWEMNDKTERAASHVQPRMATGLKYKTVSVTRACL